MQALESESQVRLQSSYLQYLPSLFRREIVLDVDARKVWVAGKEVGLGDLELDVLAYLYERQGRVCTPEEIAEALAAGPGASENGNRDGVPQIIARVRSVIEQDPSAPRYLKDVSDGYRLDADEFMGRFLLIFESILKPIEHCVDNMSLYFDPLITPEPFLPWLASWIDLVLDPTWPVQKRRDLIRLGAELFKWRGTRRGLVEYLRVYTGCTPEISEHAPGMSLGPDTTLGVNTRLGSSGGGYHFNVTLELDDGGQIDERRVRAIVNAQKPAHTVYTLKMERRNNQSREDNNAA